MPVREKTPLTLEKHLARFLRASRGEQTYADFARRLGIPQSYLHQLERAGQSVTLRRLQQIIRRLRCRLRDVLPPDWPADL